MVNKLNNTKLWLIATQTLIDNHEKNIWWISTTKKKLPVHQNIPAKRAASILLGKLRS